MTLSPQALHDLARLSSLVLTEPDLDTALVEVTRVATSAVEAADGASLTMYERGNPSTGKGSDDWAVELDRLQYVEQEGPCLDCVRTGSVMRSPDLGADPRFPSFGPRAAELGARSVISLPLAGDGRTVGALNLYSRTADAFNAEALATVELVAAHASLAIQAAAAFYSSRDLAEQLRVAIDSRAVIEQAKGVLVARHGVDPARAFELLKMQSQQTNTKLRDIAGDLVRRQQRTA